MDKPKAAPEAIEQRASKRAFVISPIGESGSEIRKRSDQVFNYVITPELQPLGYLVTRSDKIDTSGQITTQIISNIIDADLVIADLTDLNPNIFYELAIRHATAKPFIQLIVSDEKLPFDIAGLRTVMLDHRDLDSVAEAKRSIRGMVASIKPDARVETPIQQAVDFAGLQASGNPEEKQLANLSAQVAALSSMLKDDFRAHRSSAISSNDADLKAMQVFIVHLANTGRINEDDFRRLTPPSVSYDFESWAAHLLGIPSKATRGYYQSTSENP